MEGCGAKQNEGERCGDNTYGADNSDCDDGLICKAKDELLNMATHRCCYSDGHVSDARCEPKVAGSAPIEEAGGEGN